MADQMILVQEEPRGASQLIEIQVIQNGLGIVKLPDVPELRNQIDQRVIIKALRLIVPAMNPVAPTVGGAVAPLTELQKMFLILYSEQWEKGQLIPLLSLNDVFVEGSGTPFRSRTTKLDNWKDVDWAKSKIQYANGTVSVGAPYTVVLETEYIKLDPQGNPIRGVNING